MINRKKYLLRSGSYSKFESKFNLSKQLDRFPSSKSLRMHSRCRGCLVHSYCWNAFTLLGTFHGNWNAPTTKFTLFWSRCTLLCIENQAGLSSSIEITDKLHHRGARQVACANFAIVSKQNTEYFLAENSPQHKTQRVQNRRVFRYII